MTWTVMSILNWSANYLKEKGVDDARTVVEWLLCDTLSCSRMDLYLKFDRPLNDGELSVFKPMLLKCAAKQPVQQVVGSCEFYGLKLALDDTVLIPRPETERLVEEAIRLAGDMRKARQTAAPQTAPAAETDAEAEIPAFVPPAEIRILDIGSGSGCIAVALAMHIPEARLIALERSEDALKVLERNIHFYNLEKRVAIEHRDIREYRPAEPFDMIVSNPPYIAGREMPSLETNVSYYEPRMALSDEGDGLSFYRLFAEKFPEWLKEDGSALLEFGGAAQTSALTEIFSAYERRIVRDYQQDDRVLVLRKKQAAAKET
ncbi:MAG: peptide chain release factor N(5)-glutamine methyltransferase [Candidatus Marinimicrobia bacterium]|nr:peptide chain release factor N(5)-glutamine methyltransferase [Candidatus Neomarinimicrobiota bacterium]